MTAKDLKQKYLSFFVKKGHKKLPNVSLVPEGDPTTLFISAGIQPLVPYFLGEPHPLGRKLVSLQRCLRTGDIEEVGDVFHNTFFEMLGNWSLGAYWKEGSLSLSYEFLTKCLDLDPKRLHVTIFKGDKNAPKDEESEKIWLSLGIPKERIYPLGKKDNWWDAGQTGPGGPDSEIFYDVGRPACGPQCRPGDGCSRFFEMWNNVFIEYSRQPDGIYKKLKQRNVDTGMGVERTSVVLEGKDDVFKTTPLAPIIKKIEELSKKKYWGEDKNAMRIIADHLRAATFVIADGVLPSNIEQGYVLRRLIRRSLFNGRKLGLKESFASQIVKTVVDDYSVEYPLLKEKEMQIGREFLDEEEKFLKTISEKRQKEDEKKYREIARKGASTPKAIMQTANVAFGSAATYGTPVEFSLDIAELVGTISPSQRVEVEKVVDKLRKEHQKKSRASLDKKFKGGLADHSMAVTKLHTATHLLHQALQDVLGDHVRQIGSNITPERLRFDFTHPKRLTEAETKKIERIINEKIKADLPVKMEMMGLVAAKKKGARALFRAKYGDKVKVYSIDDYSCEVCGGPHVKSTGVIGGVKIYKEKAIGTGRRRLYAKLAS